MEFSRQINEATVEHYLPAFEALDELAVKISGADFSSADFGELENEIQQIGQEVLRQMAQGYLNQRRQSEKKKEFVIGEDGYSRRHRRIGCIRQLESRFGGVSVSRIGYRGPELNFVFPLDADLNLPLNKYSPGLQAEVAHLVAVESFDETLESLQRQGGGTLPKRQLQEVSVELVQDYEAFYKQPLKPTEALGERILVITADGKGVSMHNQDLRTATRLGVKKKRSLQPGEKKGHRRMASVVSVYEVALYLKTSGFGQK